MVPLETARIDHPDLTAENVRVTGIGHLALPVHPAVATRIRQVLDAEPTRLRRVAGTAHAGAAASPWPEAPRSAHRRLTDGPRTALRHHPDAPQHPGDHRTLFER